MVSNREYQVRHHLAKIKMNQPSRSDYYVMQLTRVVRQLVSDKEIELEDFKIPFTFDGEGDLPSDWTEEDEKQYLKQQTALANYSMQAKMPGGKFNTS